MRSDLENNRSRGIKLISGKLAAEVQALTTDVSIPVEGSLLRCYNPNGADRTLTLPAASRGLFYVVCHSGSAHTLDLHDALGDVVATLTFGQSAWLFSDDTTWHPLVATSGLFGPAGVGHSTGLVPDPGAVSGLDRVLKDDGSWATIGTPGFIDAYKTISDGTHLAVASGLDQLRLRSSSGAVVLVVTNNDPTYGNVVDFTLDEANIDHNLLKNFVANKHIDHTSVSINPGSGLSGGGDISATRTLSFDPHSLALITPELADEFPFYDISGAVNGKATFTTLNGILDHNALLNYAASRHIDHSAVSVAAGSGLSGGGTIDTTRTLSLDIHGLTADTIASSDELVFYDVSGADTNKITFGDFISSMAGVGGAALTKTDDTNVTLTLGGAPTTALLSAASLTLGWTGVLSQARGGTGTTTPSILTLAGGNKTFAVPGTYATIQAALNAAATFDYQNLYTATVTVAAGTYSEQINLQPLANCLGATITFATGVTVSDTGTSWTFWARQGSNWTLGGAVFSLGGSYGGIHLDTYSQVTIGVGITFSGSLANGGIDNQGGTFLAAGTTNNTTTSAMGTLIYGRGLCLFDNANITFTNAVTFTSYVIGLDDTLAFFAGDNFTLTNGSNVTASPGLIMSNGAFFETDSNTKVDGTLLSRSNFPGGVSIDVLSHFQPDGLSFFPPDNFGVFGTLSTHAGFSIQSTGGNEVIFFSTGSSGESGIANGGGGLLDVATGNLPFWWPNSTSMGFWGPIGWGASSNGTYSVPTIDTAFSRNAARMVELNDGTEASNAGIVLSQYFIRQHATYTLSNSASVQKLFNGSTNGTITLPVGVYEFECYFSLSSMSATSGNAAFSIANGTGTATNFLFYWGATDGAAGATGTWQNGMATTSATPAAMATAGTATTLQAVVKGTFEISIAGTIVPSIQLANAAAAIVAIGSIFKCKRIAATAATVVQGNWS